MNINLKCDTCGKLQSFDITTGWDNAKRVLDHYKESKFMCWKCKCNKLFKK